MIGAHHEPGSDRIELAQCTLRGNHMNTDRSHPPLFQSRFQSKTSFRIAALGLALSISGASAQSYREFISSDQQMKGFQALGVDVADFDHDGDLDAVMTRTNGELQLLRNNGSGEFTPWNGITLSSNQPGRPVVGDFNNDGNMDIVCPISGSNAVMVVKTNANGTFQSPQVLPFDANPSAVAVEGFDSNGFLDIVAISRETNAVKVYLGNGTSFPTVRTFFTNHGASLGIRPLGVATGDLNNDGKPDIVTTNYNSEDVGVYYASGNGFFFSGDFAYYLSQPSRPFAVELEDMNNDGDIDIVLSRGEGEGDAEITWMRNDYNGGAETFPDFNNGSWSTPVGGRVVDLAIGVFTCNSSLPDVVGANEGNTSEFIDSIDILTNPGIGALTSRPSIPSLELSPNGVATGDFDNDGDIDIIQVDLFSGFRVHLNRCIETPCPADFTDDRVLDFFDVSAFLDAFAANDPAADLTGDGVYDFFDVSAFLDAFGAGCP